MLLFHRTIISISTMKRWSHNHPAHIMHCIMLSDVSMLQSPQYRFRICGVHKDRHQASHVGFKQRIYTICNDAAVATCKLVASHKTTDTNRVEPTSRIRYTKTNVHVIFNSQHFTITTVRPCMHFKQQRESHFVENAKNGSDPRVLLFLLHERTIFSSMPTICSWWIR
jgi:hypothetical protein